MAVKGKKYIALTIASKYVLNLKTGLTIKLLMVSFCEEFKVLYHDAEF